MGLGDGRSQQGALSRKQQGALSRKQQGAGLCSYPSRYSGKASERPLESWPNTHPDLVIRALRVNFPQTDFEIIPFRMCLDGQQQPTVAYPVVHVSVTLWMCDFEILNEPKCIHGLVKI